MDFFEDVTALLVWDVIRIQLPIYHSPRCSFKLTRGSGCVRGSMRTHVHRMTQALQMMTYIIAE